MITINTKNYDSVIESHFLTGHTDYKVAVETLYPLINRLQIQRKLQTEKFYKRLELDLKNGCIMPPLTIAIVAETDLSKKQVNDIQKFVNDNINKAFILDGIQRLNTLKRVHDRDELDLSKPIFLNIIICKSRDNLLYRMITLNNGQKPMTARHQIEMLASNIYDFKKLGIELITEKETAQRRPRNAFKKSDIISAYIAFLSDTTTLESSKIIESKMDELIARKIISSRITTDGIEFSDLIKEIARLIEDEYLLKWFKNLNNLLGFCVGAKSCISKIRKTSISDFKDSIKTFEEAFAHLDVSKIKLSRERRKLSEYLFHNFNDLEGSDSDELLLTFNEID
jgi:hypothetical protein